MWNTIRAWLHHLFNPHCVECRDEDERVMTCETCEVLKVQLSLANQRERELVSALTSIAAPSKPEPASQDVSQFRPILPKRVPWHIRKQELEKADRETAQKMAQFKRDEEEAKKATAKTDTVVDMEELKELEIEIGIAEQVREGFNAGNQHKSEENSINASSHND